MKQQSAELINSGNVTRFRRLRDDAPPLLAAGDADRPAPDFLAASGRASVWTIFLACSLLAHAGLAAFLLDARDAAPAVGLEVISVELVFGADAPAGVATSPGDVEASHPEAPQPLPRPPGPPEKQEAAEPAFAPARPIPPDPGAFERRNSQENKRRKEPARPSRAASNVGRGQSGGDANYNGRVAAHLARHKRFPPDAQSERSHGTAVVSFRLDGGGRVITVALVGSSGVPALDPGGASHRASRRAVSRAAVGRQGGVYSAAELPRQLSVGPEVADSVALDVIRSGARWRDFSSLLAATGRSYPIPPHSVV